MPSRKEPLLQVSVTPDVEKLIAMIDSFPVRQFHLMKANVQETFDALKTVMVKRSSQGPLYRRTGRLARSWSVRPQGYNLRTFAMTAGSFSSYSIKHETGGLFYPDKARYFWIPLGPNLKANRTAKISPTKAIDLVRQGLWRIAGQAKGSPDLEKVGKRNVILNEHNEPVYVRVRSIYLKPQLQFQPIAEIFVRRTIERLNVLNAKLATQAFSQL